MEQVYEREQRDVGRGQLSAADELPARDQPVQPGRAFLRDLLQIVAGRGNSVDAVQEHLDPAAIAKSAMNLRADLGFGADRIVERHGKSCPCLRRR
jgi:hypothetical protein